MLCDEVDLHRFGTPLPALEEEDVPATKKPIQIEDQIVTDENGKRRFHGAFTGGFSAGFWNTVGSLEGWTPQSFKSSRSEKTAQRLQQRPEDFMDEEDLGEFGIAPQRVQAREDFSKDSADTSSRKRKLMQKPADGPIPGMPVLEQLLRPVADKVAVRILKSMGWRPGQGIGPRLTRTDKKKAKEHNKRELYLMQHYGCQLEGSDEKSSQKENNEAHEDSTDGESDTSDDDEITFAPDDFEPFLCAIKNNRFGLGYSGLSRDPVLSKGSGNTATMQHINLFGPLEVLGKDNKKLSIRGQAFGVGALEEEDDDIYERDDMSKYDFSLDDKNSKKKKIEKHVQDNMIVEGFAASKSRQFKAPYIVELPTGYRPRNWAMRKSRFAPLEPEKEMELKLQTDYIKRGLGRHEMDPQQRGAVLGEQPISAASTKVNEKPTLQQINEKYKAREDKTKELLERITAKNSNFTCGGIITAEGEEKSKESIKEMEAAVQDEHKSILEKAQAKTKHLASTSGNFKPFLGDEAKQKRYEEFIAANLQAEEEISDFLRNIQPIHLSEWDREMEKKEFIQARKIYKPLGGIMSDRFVSEATVAAEKAAVEAEKTTTEKKPNVKMERTKTIWKPNSLLCKRYNIAEPFGGTMVDEKQPKKAKLSVFDYIEFSVNTKSDFQTPVIIPKHIEKPKVIIKQPVESIIEEEQQQQQQPRNEDLLITPSNDSNATSSKDIKPARFVPKSDLEKMVDEQRDKPPEEKIELFKAIFDDSDDDNNEESNEKSGKESSTSKKTSNPIDSLFPTLPKPTSATAANLLRNTSPPRGIFAALFSTPFDKKEAVPTEQQSASTLNTEVIKAEKEKGDITKPATISANVTQMPPKITFKSKSERLQSDNDPNTEQLDSYYGPKIPEQLLKKPDTTTTTEKSVEPNIDNKIIELLEKHKSVEYNKSSTKKTKPQKDEWIEKNISEANSDDDSGSSIDSSNSSSTSSSCSNTTSRSKKKKFRRLKLRKDKKRKKKKDKKKIHKKHEKSHKSKKSKKCKIR